MPNPVDPTKGNTIPGIRPMFRTMGIAASGLSAQRLRMETIAMNIANAETTHTAAGGPYKRRVVQMEAATAEDFQKSLNAARESVTPDALGRSGATGVAAAAARNRNAAAGLSAAIGSDDPIAAAQAAFDKKIAEADKAAGTTQAEAEEGQGAGTGDPWGVKVIAINEDPSEGPLVYDPAHPDADPNGYVRMPNVRITDELIDMMDAKRMYEANVTVFQAAKQMLRRSIEI